MRNPGAGAALQAQVFSFDRYELRRAVDVLSALVQRCERVVSKAELFEAVWPGLVVEDNNLQVHISALRKLLGPDLIARARLLVVDDHRVHRLLLARVLELQGHEVASADSGGQAWASLQGEATFDLLLLDLDMPGINGFELLQRLAEHPQRQQPSVIVTSALEGTANVVRCIELGADDYLHKPVDPQLLKARVDTSLAKKRRHDQQRQAAERFAGAVLAQALASTGFRNGGRRFTATVLACGVRGA